MKNEAKTKKPRRTENDTDCRECGKEFGTREAIDRHELVTDHDPYGVGC
jgi:hypothetical protein